MHRINEDMPYWEAILASILENAQDGDTVVMGSEAGVESARTRLAERADHKQVQVVRREPADLESQAASLDAALERDQDRGGDDGDGRQQ